ncbi:hypothetical protein ACIHEI_21180 [Kitasatospora sp. NPDC051984]|uniref:hypothetical protein n=1 Tax=Kitasatospora sp. NPDC051984 TaxID=3364059 RepID=UPI0037C5E18B
MVTAYAELGTAYDRQGDLSKALTWLGIALASYDAEPEACPGTRREVLEGRLQAHLAMTSPVDAALTIMLQPTFDARQCVDAAKRRLRSEDMATAWGLAKRAPARLDSAEFPVPGAEEIRKGARLLTRLPD